MQYESPTLLLVLVRLVLSLYSGVALCGSAADQTRIWTTALMEFVFMAGEMFIVNANVGDCSTYYSGVLLFYHVSGRLLFRLSATFLDTLMYIGLYTSALRMGTEPVLTALAFMRGTEVDWGKLATKYGFVLYAFESRQVLMLEKESIQVEKGVRCSEGCFTDLTLELVPVFFRADRGRVDITGNRPDYNEYSGLNLNSNPASSGNLYALFV